MRVDPVELAVWVDAHPVDPDVVGFFADCDALGLDVRVVSDGYDWVIQRVMARLVLEHVPVFANSLRAEGDGRWSVAFPNTRPRCGSGTCKCEMVARRRPRMHIGDGRSDACVSDRCELVFAKDSLLASRQARSLPYVAFQNFSQIRAALKGAAPTWPVAECAAAASEA